MASTTVGTPSARSGPTGYGPQGRSAWLDVDWREHLRWARVDGSAVSYVDMGEGEPLVFVHGLSGCWQNWLENIPHVAATRRVIALDLPGFGNSEMPREPISIKGYAATVDALLAQLGIERTVVVGNSMGGFIGAELAIDFATRVEKLVLISAAGIASQEMHNGLAFAGLRRAQSILAAVTGWGASKADAFARRPGLRNPLLAIVAAHPGQLPAPLVAEQLHGSGKPGFIDALEALTVYPIEDRLEQIECPTLVVWGAKDRLVPVRDADRFVDAIGANARKIVYEDTGHVSMFERPDRFNADLDAFLAEAVQPGDAQ